MAGILLRGGQEVASPGQNRTGMCLIPFTKFDRSLLGSSASLTPGIRSVRGL
jgi:hypothetical protein